jgi:hypothetical protein
VTGRIDPRRLPGWVQALLVMAASRVLFSYVAHRAADLAPAHPGGRHWTYLEIANNWDGTWYHRVALEGYPAVLPHTASGAVAPSTWAFYPLFPYLTRWFGRLTGLDWTPAATVVSLTCAFAAAVVIRGVLARVTGPRIALWAVALLCFFPAAPVLQLPYSESLALLLLAAVFGCLQRGRHLVAVPLIVLLGLARPVGAPIAVVLGVHLLARAWAARELPGGLRGRPARRVLAGPVLTCLAGGVAAVEWPLIVWWRTGVRNGYTLTMAAWRNPPELVPVRPWYLASQHFFGQSVGPLVLVAGIALVTWWVVRHGRRVVGLDLAVWCGAYSVYLLAVLDSFTSLPRYLLPLFPLGAMYASVSSSRAFRLTATAGFAALGVVWMLVIWRSHLWAP